jgi:hypothetical protein
MNRRGLSPVELMLVFVVCLTLILYGLGTCTISDGKRVGVVTKFSYKGFISKTWEGDLLSGGQGAVTGAHWNFTCDKPELVNKINKALDHQEMIELGYTEYLAVAPWSGDTKYFITSAEVVAKEKQK